MYSHCDFRPSEKSTVPWLLMAKFDSSAIISRDPNSMHLLREGTTEKLIDLLVVVLNSRENTTC